MILPFQLQQQELARPFRVTILKQADEPLNRLSRRHTDDPHVRNRYL
jgi:hypothetical protein